MNNIKEYIIAGLRYRVVFEDGVNNESHLPSSAPFEVEPTADETALLFTLRVDDKFRPDQKGSEIGKFDCGGAMHELYHTEDGFYQIVISNEEGRKCCLMQTRDDFSDATVALTGTDKMRTFALNNALMIMYAFASSDKSTLLMHSSVVRKDGRAYMCLGTSGTGKSTHTGLWIKHIPGADLMNDDNPVVRFVDGKAMVYGSPWSGKTPCYRNIEAPIGGILQLKQAPYNKIRRQTTIEAFASMLTSCSVMKWDKRVYSGICDTITLLMEAVPNWFLECLPDREAALTSYEAMNA
ncbi:MAG: hypothetical protein IJY78_02700 [Bacteroidaceae bacterium]|nr:hypothetical protein [Bacteroidaceae bacterium]